MKIKAKLKLNVFSYSVDGVEKGDIPAYILQFDGKLLCFGKEALRSAELYPGYVWSLSRAILEDDLESFRRIIESFYGYIQLNYGGRVDDLEILDYLPDKFISVISKCAGVRQSIPSFRKDDYCSVKGALINSGQVDGKGRQVLGDKRMLLLQMFQMAASCEGPIADRKQYRQTLLHLVSVLKSRFPDVISQRSREHGNILLRTADQRGNIARYRLDHRRQLPKEINSGPLKFKSREDEWLYHILSSYAHKNMNVIFISPFSYGKSTIINGIAGFDALKMEYTAETSVITEVLFSPVQVFVVEYMDGNVEIVAYRDKEDLKQLLPKYNGINAQKKDIRRITLHSPESDLPGISLIDSPGLLSIHTGHDKIADSMIKNADLVMFVVDPMQVGARSYMVKIHEYIKKLGITKYCFIVNKLDTVYHSREKIEKELYLSMEQFAIPKAPVFMLSGLLAYAGKCLEKGTMSLDTVRRMREVFIYDEEGDILSGKLLKESHTEDILSFSNIQVLENYLFELFVSKT